MPAQVSLWKQIIIVSLLLGTGGAAWQEREIVLSSLGFDQQTSQPRRDRAAGVPVIVARVEMDRDDLTLEAVGTDRAQRSVMLRPEASGKITEIAMVAGQSYKAGDVLLRLDDTDQQLAVRLSETRLKEAVRVRDRVAQLQISGNAAAARFDEARTAAEIAALELIGHGRR